jgi:hypothetical protein
MDIRGRHNGTDTKCASEVAAMNLVIYGAACPGTPLLSRGGLKQRGEAGRPRRLSAVFVAGFAMVAV